MKMFRRQLGRESIFIFGLLVQLFASSCQITPVSEGGLAHVSKIAESKKYVESKVLQLKATPNISTNDMAAGKDLYDRAQAAYEGYLSALEAGIRNSSDLTSKKLTDLGNEAGQKAAAFTDFATKHSAVSYRGGTGASEIAGILVDGGIKVWKAYREMDRTARTQAADDIHKQLEWRNWADIKNER